MDRLESIAGELSAIDDPWTLLKRASELVEPGKLSLGTSGQLTGTAILEGAHRQGIALHTFTVDTQRLFPETVAYFDKLESHYGIKIDRVAPNDDELQKMIDRHGVFLFFDSKGKQEYCCEVRKVRPNYVALAESDIWLTGLRHDQSAFRKDTPAVQIVEIPDLKAESEGQMRRLVKVAPLITWNEQDVRTFLAEGDAPIHPLLEESDSEWFFESLGCVICTTRQAKWEPPRAGRWRWFNDDDPEKKECGIHLPPPSHLQEQPAD